MYSCSSLLSSEKFRFVIVGGAVACVYFVLVTVMIGHGFGAVLAALTAYCISFFVGYFFQRNFSFRSKVHHRQSLPRYALLQIACAITAMISAEIAVTVKIEDPYKIGLITTGALGFISYLFSSRWVFRHED